MLGAAVAETPVIDVLRLIAAAIAIAVELATDDNGPRLAPWLAESSVVIAAPIATPLMIMLLPFNKPWSAEVGAVAADGLVRL